MRRMLIYGLIVATAGCFGGRRGRKGTVPVEPDLPPLPEYAEMCISKAVVLPSKMNGKRWDGLGRMRRKDAKMLSEMAGAAAGGGYAAAIAAAGTVGVSIFNKVKGPPDVRVRVQLGREYIIRTDPVKDTAIAAFGASKHSCAVLERKEYSERLQFFVEDIDVGRPEMIGTKSFVGIPPEAIHEGTWQIYGFEGVVEIEMTFQPMQKPRARQALPEETAPPTLDDGEDADADEAGEAPPSEPGTAPDPAAEPASEPAVKEIDW